MSKYTLSLIGAAVCAASAGVAQARPFKIAAPSNPAITTQTLRSGDFEIGISDLGGGYINKLVIAGKGDIMGKVSDRYGRGGQSAIRDRLHHGHYNPTQAGFTDKAGTQCQVVKSPGKLTITPRPCCLWDADGQYDFTQWENLAPDNYRNDHGDTDQDGIDESHLPGKQATEITSEFDYYGYYQNMKGKDAITIPCIKHYFEYRFIRKPGDAMKQFGPKTSQYVPRAALADLTVNHPVGVHPARPYDLSKCIGEWALRGDTAKWNPHHAYFLKNDGRWHILSRDTKTRMVLRGPKGHPHKVPAGFMYSVYGPNAAYQPLIIVSDSNNPDKGLAIGQYWPKSPVNVNCVVGRLGNGTQVYTDPRMMDVRAQYNPKRIPTMWRFGFLFDFRGLLNRTETPPGVYETFRTEVYMLVGTPNQIREAARKISLSLQKTESPSH